MEQNGKVAEKNPLSVWRDESNTGLDTIRKILLAAHIEETEKQFADLTQNYERIFLEMEQKLAHKEAEFALKLQAIEDRFQAKFDELKSNFVQELTAVEKKAIKHSDEKNTNLGKVLIQLGKEWALNDEKD